jgi:hypothetical protein
VGFEDFYGGVRLRPDHCEIEPVFTAFLNQPELEDLGSLLIPTASFT